MKLDSNITAIVTGGASGLGEATARMLAEKGVKIGIFDLNEERGEAVAAELGGAFAKVNVTNEEETDAGFAKIRGALGQERILINCAGTGNAIKTASRNKETGEVSHFPLDAFNLIIQINLVGTFRCIAKSAAGMMTLDPLECGDRGAMVNTASVAAEDGQIGQAAYSASKGGVRTMTKAIALDLADRGTHIRANSIHPGFTATPMVEDSVSEMEPEEAAQFATRTIERVPLGLGEADQIAAATVFLFSKDSSFMTGSELVVDGGFTAA